MWILHLHLPLTADLVCADSQSEVALVFGQMNEPPGARARVALTGLVLFHCLDVFNFRDVRFSGCKYGGWFFLGT